LDEDKLTFIILAPNPASSKPLAAAAPPPPPAPPPLDELLHKSSGLPPTDKCLADDFQMIGDVNLFLHGAIPPPPQPSSPQAHPTTSSGNSTVPPLHPSAKEWQSQNFFVNEEVKDSEEDIDDGGDGDFQAEVEIMIAGTYLFSALFYFLHICCIRTVLSPERFST
jgi:hypothetical protein